MHHIPHGLQAPSVSGTWIDHLGPNAMRQDSLAQLHEHE
jgi:hypothetical protein